MPSRIVPFQVEHLEVFNMRESDAKRLAMDPRTADKMIALANMHTGGTLFYDGRIVGIFGYYEMWPGVIELWAFPSVYAKRYAMIYLRSVKRYLNGIVESFKPHRVQTCALADELHDEWMKFLGLECEIDILRQYSADKQDYRMWSKIYGAEPINVDGRE